MPPKSTGAVNVTDSAPAAVVVGFASATAIRSTFRPM
jgi:hypothetical protein